MEPLVSVVIPIYNAEKYIEICMNSLLGQAYKNIEIIMVDDGSTDSSASICDAYAEKDKRIKVIHQVNKGVSTARNAGISAAQGKYIMFFDVDDTVETDIITDNVQLAEENEADIVMYCFWYYNVDEDKTIPNPWDKSFVGDNKAFFDECVIKTVETEVFNPPWNKVIKRSLIQDNKLSFDVRYQIYEDAILSAEMLNAADKIVVNNRMYYRYCIKSSGSLITKFNDTFFDSVSKLHSNAIKYCQRYEDNKAQIECFNKQYTTLVLTHLKQISCKADWDKAQKYQLIKRICEDEQFTKAINNTDLKSTKKKIMRRLIIDGRYRAICRLYKLLNKLQGN